MLDELLKRGKTVEEIVEFFRTYQMEGGLSFEPRVYRQSRSSSRQSSVEPEEELADKLSFKVKTRDNGNSNETRSNENNSQNKNSADDLKRTSEPKENTDLQTNASCKINEDGDMQDTKELQESNDVDVVKEKGWGNATEKMEQSLTLSNLDNMVRNVETENRIVEKLSKISERKGHEPDQKVSTNINFCENMTENSPPRNVFDLVDADFIKRMIPFMHPKSRNHTFKYFLDKVDEVVEAVGEDKILNSEILDLMQYR